VPRENVSLVSPTPSVCCTVANTQTHASRATPLTRPLVLVLPEVNSGLTSESRRGSRDLEDAMIRWTIETGNIAAC